MFNSSLPNQKLPVDSKSDMQGFLVRQKRLTRCGIRHFLGSNYSESPRAPSSYRWLVGGSDSRKVTMANHGVQTSFQLWY